jgi:phage terminase small subunit
MTEATEELKPLTKLDRLTLDEYFKCWNGTRAWMKTHPRSSYNAARVSAAKWIAKPNIKAAIEDRLAEVHMSADEALAIQSEIARTDLGTFFKVVEKWMYNPLPTQEIIDEKEELVPTEDGPQKRVSYLVRSVVLDTAKLVDPRYSHLLHKFSDSKRGMSIETYDKQAANRDVLKVAGKIKDGVTIQKAYVNVSPDDWDKGEE